MGSNENEEYDELCDIPFADGDPAQISDTEQKIPYKTVYKNFESFKYPQQSVFIPNEAIKVRITKYERNMTKHLLNPYLYTLEVSHGSFSWTLHKRYKHFFALHQQLKLFRASLLIPFPSDTHRANRETLKHDLGQGEADVTPKKVFPRTKEEIRFPKRPEALIGYGEIEDRLKQLEDYLNVLLTFRIYRDYHETLKFLSVSHFSFISDLGVKTIEGFINKQTGSTRRCYCCGLLDCTCCTRFGHLLSDTCGCWRERWMIVKDTWVGYLRPKDARLRRVILFDQEFQAALSLYNSALQISNLQMRIVFKCNGRRRRTEWCQAIRDVAERQGHGFISQNRYSSYAPIRVNSGCSWFIDGASYMEAVADAIESATEEIFIADWWLSPEIYLKRPSLYGEQWRLDMLLQAKALAGVKIFVLLYKEVEMALGINSYYSKSRLSKYHENIKVLRHPDRASSGIFLWAHHEKIVCIDQNLCFLGGIDLCYGRWDDYQHRLTDFGGYILPDNPNVKKFTSSRPLGSEFVKTVIADLETVAISEPDSNNGDETKENEEEKLKCDSPESQRKSLYSRVQESTKSLIAKLTETSDVPAEEEPIAPKIVTDVDGAAFSKPHSVKYWIGKDYCNFIVKDFTDLESPYKDLVDRRTTPRMPWHDVGVFLHGASARDVARHFIQRWNAVKMEKAKKNPQYPYLTPKSYENFDLLPSSLVPLLNVHSCSTQILRSISSWSGGFLDPNKWEESIHEAYLSLISRAEHYIYIENQFFITSVLSVGNLVGEQLYKRILKAHREQKSFRVYIVLPLLPGFEGQVGSRSGTALHAITHWLYRSLCRGDDSLFSKLMAAGVENPSDYITVHGLRNHGLLHGEPVTELIYVHSKLIIVDDRFVICGSANINDRSLTGKRDSEIAVVIQDEDLTQAVFNGETVDVGVFASSLRKQLFAEHLGVNIDQVEDPVSEEFYRGVWKTVSERNTALYEEIFRCIPSDKVVNFQQMNEYLKEIPPCSSDVQLAKEKVVDIQGHLVDLPLKFLEEETLTPNAASMEGIMPTSVWT